MIPIYGRRIALREFTVLDVESAWHVVGDDRVTKWLSFDSRDIAATESMVRGAIERSAVSPRNEYYLAIVRLEDNELVGFIRLGLSGVKAGKLGYALRPDAWRQGYGLEAVRLMLRFAFNSLGLHRVTAAIGPDNVGSISLIRRVGLNYEGRLRDHVFTNNVWRDSLLYSLLESEWDPDSASYGPPPA